MKVQLIIKGEFSWADTVVRYHQSEQGKGKIVISHTSIVMGMIPFFYGVEVKTTIELLLSNQES